MQHLVDAFLKEIRKKQTENSKLKDGIPPAYNELYLYAIKIKYESDPSYKKLINTKFDELDEKVAKMNNPTFEEFTLNSAITFWETDREEMLKEIECYISLSIEQQQSSYFHNIALGLWEAWSKDYLHDVDLNSLVKCMNKQILNTGNAPQFNNGKKAKGGAPKKIDKVNVLMTFISQQANVTAASKQLGTDPKEVRRHLKSIVGSDYSNILKVEHKFYPITQFVYNYWSAR